MLVLRFSTERRDTGQLRPVPLDLVQVKVEARTVYR